MISNDFLDSVEFDLSQGAIPTEVIDLYEMGHLLFESDHSQIFQLVRLSDCQLCTLKAISKESSLTFDFKSIQNLKHPRLPKVFYVGESSKFVYVIKEYISGTTLRQYLETNAPLQGSEIHRLCLQLLEVVEYFHDPERNIVYRDIKPDNIIIDENGGLHLIDLETIRIVKKESNSDTVSIVTRGFASPEQYGYSQTDHRSDIYAIGATLYYMFKQCPPSPFNAAYDEIPSNWKGVISKCLKFNPNHRFKNVSRLKKEVHLIHRPYTKKMKVLASLFMLILAIGLAAYNVKKDVLPEDQLTSSAIKPTTNLETLEQESSSSFIELSNTELIQKEEDLPPEVVWQIYPEDVMVYTTYMKRYNDIPEKIVDKNFEFIVTFSGAEVEGVHSVYMYQMDYYGHNNQTGADFVTFRNGTGFTTFSSPATALHYIKGQYYDFIAYVDDNKNRLLDTGERYSILSYRLHDGNLNQYLKFNKWYVR